jgi:hypothetical protein
MAARFVRHAQGAHASVPVDWYAGGRALRSRPSCCAPTAGRTQCPARAAPLSVAQTSGCIDEIGQFLPRQRRRAFDQYGMLADGQAGTRRRAQPGPALCRSTTRLAAARRLCRCASSTVALASGASPKSPAETIRCFRVRPRVRARIERTRFPREAAASTFRDFVPFH